MVQAPEDAILLYWGLGLNPFPEILEPLLHRGRIDVRPVDSLHDAAALFAILGSMRVRALLIDSVFVTSRHARDLQLFRRHLSLPVISLPGFQGLGAHGADRCHEIIPWAQAGEWIEQFGENAVTCSRADNEGSANAEENAVTSSIDARYDEFSAQPLLSEQEIRALLGAAEE